MFARDLLRIQTKDSGFQPFVLNRPQRMRERLLDELAAQGKPVRVVECKSRQLGTSTHVQGRIFRDCVTNRDETGLLVAHNDNTVHEIFMKMKMFYDEMPDGFKPRTRYNNIKALDFRPQRGGGGLRSRINVVLPKEATSANGITARKVHVSEIAFYSNPEKFMANMLQVVPRLPDTMVYIESTPNGSGDYFHDIYQRARVYGEPKPWQPLKRTHPGDPNSGWVAVFMPWFLMEEYQAPLLCSEVEFRSSLDADEVDLLDRFSEWVTLESLQWRRERIATECGGSLDAFRTQYPATDEEAFASSGRPVFDREALAWQEATNVCWCDRCVPFVGAAVPEGNTAPEHHWHELVDGSCGESSGDRRFTALQPLLSDSLPGLGRLSVWKYAERGKQYVVSADVSKGGDSSDWDVATVLDIASMEVVAVWRGKVPIPEYADVLLMLSVVYNNAVLAPESTGIGAGLVAILERSAYWNLYRRNVFGSVGAMSTLQVGWHTGAQSKPAAVGLLQRAFREKYVIVRDRMTLDEARSYRATVQHKKGGFESNEAEMGAPPGKHDDSLMSFLIAVAVAHYLPGGSARSRAEDDAEREKELKRALTPSEWTPEEWVRYWQQNRVNLDL